MSNSSPRRRWYLVKHRNGDQRLVEARSNNQARLFGAPAVMTYDNGLKFPVGVVSCRLAKGMNG